MHILKKYILILLLIISCTPQGALTPKSAFLNLKEAYNRSDPEAFLPLLSENSIKKIKVTIDMFSKMDDKQIKSISENTGISAEYMKHLTVKDYITLYLLLEKKKGFLNKAVTGNIMGIERKGDYTVIRMDNGMELMFKKEGPYWKFDMSNL